MGLHMDKRVCTSKPPLKGQRQSRAGLRGRRRTGNAIIESVFTIMPTFALILAFVDFGLMEFRWATLQNAVREGARYAITFQTKAGMGQDNSIRTVVQQYAMGLVKVSDNPNHIFIKYYTTNNLNTPINPGGNIPGNVVQVSVENMSWPWLAPLSSIFAGTGLRNTTPINLSVYSADILGGYPVGMTSVAR